jgi:hypothetical protein
MLDVTAAEGLVLMLVAELFLPSERSRVLVVVARIRSVVVLAHGFTSLW